MIYPPLFNVFKPNSRMLLNKSLLMRHKHTHKPEQRRGEECQVEEERK